MTKFQAIKHLEDSFKHNPEFRKKWKDYIEMAVIDELERPKLECRTTGEFAEAISNRVLGLFDAAWWKNQL